MKATLICFALAAAFILAGCGSDKKSEQVGKKQTAGKDQAADTEAGEPKSKDKEELPDELTKKLKSLGYIQ